MPQLAAVTTPVLVSPRGVVYLPLGQVLALTGLPAERTAGDSAVSVPRVHGAGRTTIDVTHRTMTFGRDSVVRLDSLDIVALAGELYLPGPRLAQFIEARVDVDFASLAATIVRSPPFPSQQALAMQSRRSAADRRRDASAADGRIPRVPYHGGTGGGVFDWSVSTTGSRTTRTSSGEVRGGVALAGGDLTVGGLVAAPAIPGEPSLRGEWNYRRVFPEREWLREIDAGDVVGGGPLVRSLRGVTITNQRLFRDPFFSDVPVSPSLPQGWQYEVYQNGQLLGYSSAGDASPVYVPLRYGGTPIEVRMIGPAGQEVSSSFYYEVPPTQLPPGRFEYDAGAGACASDCRGLAFADAEYGLRRWLTLGGGTQVRRDSLRTTVLPQGSLSVTSLNGVAAQLQVVPSLFSRLLAQYTAPGPFMGLVSLGINQPGSGSPSLLGNAQSHWSADVRTAYRTVGLPTGAQAIRFEFTGEGAMRAGGGGQEHLGLGADYRRGSLLGTFERDAASGERLAGVQVLAIGPSRGPVLLRQLALQGAAAGNGRGVRAASVALSISPRNHGNLGVSYQWRATSRGSFSLGYSASLGFARISSRMTAASGADPLGTVTMTGASVLDARGETEPTFLGLGGIGSGGIAGRVFYDANGNGRLDQGDSPAIDIPVLVAGQRVRTDSTGFYHVWNVVPYEVAEVSVDTLHSFDPSWTPEQIRTWVRAAPHEYTDVNFPLHRTHELSGAIVADSGIGTTAGVTITLTERTTGQSQTALTYADGDFYVSRLPAGDYDLTVSTKALDALHAVSVPERVAFSIAPTDSQPVLDLPPIHLRPPALPQKVAAVVAKRCANPPSGVPLDSLGCPIIFKATRTITLRGVNFETDKASITAASLEVLKPIAEAIASDTSLRIEIAGHTDATGSRSHNRTLSQARADSVRAYFIAAGVSADRLVARGYGPDQPIATNRTAAGRALNRRTELRRLDHPPPPDEYTVQVAGALSAKLAERLAQRLRAAGFEPRIVTDGTTRFAVLVGRVATRAEAAPLLRRLRAKGFRGTASIAEPEPAAAPVPPERVTVPAPTQPSAAQPTSPPTPPASH